MRTAKALLLVLGLLGLTSGLAACSRARCAWQNACTAYKRSYEPCPGPPVTVDPVYDVDCGTGEAPRGHGAFTVPNPGR